MSGCSRKGRSEMAHTSEHEQKAAADLLRDVTFAGGIPDGATVRGVFWRGWCDPTALFVVHDDGSEWMYKRNGERKRWMQ